jgi:hypothetical protein
MAKRIRIGKLLLTVFLTVLIWVWADLALDNDLTISNATLTMSKSVNPALWVSFSGRPSVQIKSIVLRGPERRISDVRRRVDDGSFDPVFFLDPEQEQMARPGNRALDLVGFLKRTDKIRQLGLTVEAAEPNAVDVTVVALEKKLVTVKCIDENGNPVTVASVDPPQVEMYVPTEWAGDALVAYVTLSQRERNQARLAPLEKTPFIRLAPDQTRDAQVATVRITTPAEHDDRVDDTITNVRLGYVFSANLQGQYRVELENADAVMSAITIKATPEAKRAYENMVYHVLLEIQDSDKDAGDTVMRRDLIYNLPQDKVRTDEIIVTSPPLQARFRLLPVETPDSGLAAPSLGQ